MCTAQTPSLVRREILDKEGMLVFGKQNCTREGEFHNWECQVFVESEDDYFTVYSSC